MLRTYVYLCIAMQQATMAVRELLRADSGTTAPEYMLVLGFISLALVGAFATTSGCVAVTTMSNDLADKIRP